jgi:subtilisin family serine protease
MKYNTSDQEFGKLKSGIASAMSNGVTFDEIYDDVAEGYKQYYNMVHYYLNPEFDPRGIVGDQVEDYTQHTYGNGNVTGPEAEHGTHVAGIIGALRDNNIGVKGVASQVKLMIIRVVPDGDERDKDVANGIRYAVDNGARVINMSFGKSFSPGKKYVDEAVRYAASKDVLLVHASGNDASDNDKVRNYPNPWYEGTSTREPAWLEVGAISSSGNVASFSNYGVKTVDLFAPGVEIYSTMPGGEYKNENGTSMAAPVVSGIAAMIRSAYPSLTAVEVRKIIMDSVFPMDIKTTKPGSKKKVKFRKLCATGGMANAYRALQLAGQVSR